MGTKKKDRKSDKVEVKKGILQNTLSGSADMFVLKKNGVIYMK